MAEFDYRRTGTCGCEIVRDEKVIAWSVDEAWAGRIVGWLNFGCHLQTIMERMFQRARS